MSAHRLRGGDTPRQPNAANRTYGVLRALVAQPDQALLRDRRHELPRLREHARQGEARVKLVVDEWHVP